MTDTEAILSDMRDAERFCRWDSSCSGPRMPCRVVVMPSGKRAELYRGGHHGHCEHYVYPIEFLE